VTATTAPILAAQSPVGALLRSWRERQRYSQLDLALAADVSARHISFLETGRARPSREMLLRLAEHLEIPLRQRNRLLLAGGFAPLYQERSLDDPALQGARQAVELVLAGHRPYPAHAVDRHWNIVASNGMARPLLAEAAPHLLEAPINVLRLSLHPEGLAPRIANLGQWRSHILQRLRQQVENSGDPDLETLLAELAAYPVPADQLNAGPRRDLYESGVVVPLRLRSQWGLLSLFSTITIFGTPVDITLAELAIEAFFPADAETADILQKLADQTGR
jgi:transcriptional regulator with XRE-family HTH domain